jgi:hypothetical protein
MPSAGGAVRGPRAQSRSVPHGLCTRHGAAAAAYPPAADHPTRCAHTSRAVLGEERHGGDPPRPRPAGQAPHLKVSGRASGRVNNRTKEPTNERGSAFKEQSSHPSARICTLCAAGIRTRCTLERQYTTLERWAAVRAPPDMVGIRSRRNTAPGPSSCHASASRHCTTTDRRCCPRRRPRLHSQ